MTEVQTSPENSISEQLESALAQLSTEQIRFVVARQEYVTDKEAAEAIDIKPDTVYHWPPVVKDAVRLMAQDGLVVAQHVRRQALAKAMLVKVGGLDSDDEKIRQGASTEIIEWEMGKAAQPITGKDGGAIEIRDERLSKLTDDELAALREIAERIAGDTQGASEA